MKHLRISRKFLYGSLAIRVLGVSILLLAIPLILYSLIIYRFEERQKTRDVLIALNILGDSRVQTIENRINFQKKWLDQIASDHQVSRVSEDSETLLLSFDTKDNLVIQQSSDKERIGETLFSRKILHNYLKEPVFIFTAHDPYLSKRALFVGKKTEKNSVLLIETPLNIFVEAFGGVQNLDYDIGRSIVDGAGNFLESSDPFLLGKNLKTMIHRPLHFAAFRETAEAFEVQEEEPNFAIRIPIPQTDLYLLLDSPESSLLHSQQRQVFFKLGFLWILVLVVGGGCTLLLTWRLAKPLNQLSNLMVYAEKGDLGVRFQKDLMGFEINTIGMQFNRMIESVIHHQSEVQKERIQKERLAEELKIGRQIQRRMFPTKFPDLKDLDLTAGFLPAKEVGGDFYDVFKLDDNKVLVVIADAAGKGIPACLYSLGVRSILRSYAASGYSVDEIVRKTNNLFCVDTGDTGIFVTAWVGLYDTETRKLDYHSAGHFPVLLKHKDSTLSELQTKGIALGVVPFEKVITKSVQLEKGESLLLYTDGVVEAQNPDKKLYGKERLDSFFKDEKVTTSQAVVESLLRDVQNFAKKEPQFDDITVLAISVKSE